MRKTGFTLIELLAVITVLSIILLIAIPLVTNIIKTTQENSKEKSIQLYGRALENAVADYFAKYPEENDVTLNQLEKNNMLKYKGSKVVCDVVQISKRKVYLSSCKVENNYVDYTYGKYDPKPELNNGLVPVEYHDNKWVIADEHSDTWYDYDNQKWANAVVLKSNSIKTVGDTVTVDGIDPDVLMMYVWIPRYEYKYTNLGNQYAGGTQETPGEIEINFIEKNKIMASSNEYKIHPAFTFGDKELSGIWVGKFELSHSSKTNSNVYCVSSNCIESQLLRILPNKTVLSHNTIAEFFYAIRGIENTNSFGLSNIDTHMIKNSEWGAVAYLSQSKYGKYGNKEYDGVQREIYQNKSSEKKAGASNGTPSQETVNTQCTYDNITNNCGIGASTTGNIYGIYDMSGGNTEYVMGVYGTVTQIDETLDSKYYDVYETNLLTTACNNEECYGHALSETSNWYNDRITTLNSSKLWFVRGGNKTYGNDSGIFAYSNYYGTADEGIATRVIICEK